MERRALVLALALMLPLAFYGIPYAYAASTQSTYVRVADRVLAGNDGSTLVLQCASPSDYTQHYTVGDKNLFAALSVDGAFILDSAGNPAAANENPNGWAIHVSNHNSFAVTLWFQIICQSPITVAGIGVPEFGSLYVAIALGALVYFMLTRRMAKRPLLGTTSAPIPT